MNTAESALAVTVLAGALRAATPVIYGGLGALVSERSGTVNLGIEGLMLAGAWAAVAAQQAFHSWLLSVCVALLLAGGLGAVHAFFCVGLRASQAVTGLAFVFLCQGATAILGARLVGLPVDTGAAPPLSFLRGVPGFGPVLGEQDVMVLGAVVLVAITSVFLFRTKWGIVLRACGEEAASAAAQGVPVRRVRLLAGAVCGAFCGLGGAHLSLFYAQQWQENMVAGRGWVALVMVIFGMWRPGWLMVGAYLFGGMATLQLNLQAGGLDVPQYLLAILPFAVTLILLIVGAWLARRRASLAPADLGKPFDL